MFKRREYYFAFLFIISLMCFYIGYSIEERNYLKSKVNSLSNNIVKLNDDIKELEHKYNERMNLEIDYCVKRMRKSLEYSHNLYINCLRKRVEEM